VDECKSSGAGVENSLLAPAVAIRRPAAGSDNVMLTLGRMVSGTVAGWVKVDGWVAGFPLPYGRIGGPMALGNHATGGNDRMFGWCG